MFFNRNPCKVVLEGTPFPDRQPQKSRRPTVGIAYVVPYVNRIPSPTTVDEIDHEIHPPYADHGSGTASIG